MVVLNSGELQKLDSDLADEFHTTTAKGLFVCVHARLDIQPTVAFLTTRIKHPDEDNWKKLNKMVKYLNGTKDLVLTLSADSLGVCKWYIDASHATHHDMKGHTGGTMTMEKGSIMSKSLKQKINTRISTETELVATNDILLDVLWSRYFLMSQGYKSMRSVIMQDNRTAMLLETNGIFSSTKRTKHINFHYFFIKDKIEKREVELAYCPTESMLGDFFTKPLQGKKFVEFHKKIINLNKKTSLILRVIES